MKQLQIQKSDYFNFDQPAVSRLADDFVNDEPKPVMVTLSIFKHFAGIFQYQR